MVNIQTLSAIEAIRRRPQKFWEIDDLTSRGLHQLINCLVDTLINPQHLNECTNLKAEVCLGNILSIQDNGCGQPLPSNISSDSRPMIERVLTSIFAGSRDWDENTYRAFGCLINLGCVINALSEWLILETVEKNVKYRIRCERGRITQNLYPIEETKEKGTYIQFKPDASIWSASVVSVDILKSDFEQMKIKYPKIHLLLIDETAEKEYHF